MTATIAKKQNKKIFCVPSNINNKYTRTNELIKEGAILVTSADDILRELYIEKKDVRDSISVEDKIQKEKVRHIPYQYKNIYNQLSDEPIHINEICQKTGSGISIVNGVLTILELDGYIKQLPGKMFRLP